MFSRNAAAGGFGALLPTDRQMPMMRTSFGIAQDNNCDVIEHTSPRKISGLTSRQIKYSSIISRCDRVMTSTIHRENRKKAIHWTLRFERSARMSAKKAGKSLKNSPSRNRPSATPFALNSRQCSRGRARTQRAKYSRDFSAISLTALVNLRDAVRLQELEDQQKFLYHGI